MAAQTPPTLASTPRQPAVNPVVTDNDPAVEVVPKSRKRSKNSENWKKAKVSKAYNTGTIKRGDEKVKRSVKERCQCKRRKCSTITDDQRTEIFNSFWSESSTAAIRQSFIIGHTEKKVKIRGVLTPTYQRGENVYYFLTVLGRRVPVCERFFISTLSISKRMIHYNLSKVVNGIRQVKEKRVAANKTCAASHTKVHNHISSYPKIESHYCRSDTKREYLESSLTTREMYRAFCRDNEDCVTSETYYRKVFSEEFNLGFHKPSKDMCDTCDSYLKHKQNNTLTPDLETKQLAHIRRKDAARASKAVDKVLVDGTLAVAFDLQQVLTVPRLFAAKSYYKRKLNMYNLTFYELQTNQGHCYTWTEAEANRGANDIATAVILFLEMLDVQGLYEHIILYSDTCGGQNRNRHLITAIVSFLDRSHHIKKISQKFFESGHSHMECDSMHSCIEDRFSSREIELPSDYIHIMSTAKRTGQKPYKVTELTHTDILDYSELNQNVMSPTAFNGIMKVHHIRYAKTNSDPSVSMSEEIDGEAASISYRKRGGRFNLQTVQKCYDERPGISAEKKADVISLISQMTNKTMANLYYKDLPVN